MSEPQWPYSLPIWRSHYRAASPDGVRIAQINPAWEVSMGNPTSGLLCVSTGLHIERCNPSFLWSHDSRYLAVPRYVHRFGLFRRQRMVVVDVVERRGFASPETAFYFQPESFAEGILTATKEPFHSATLVTWRIPETLAGFEEVALRTTASVDRRR